MKNYLKSIKKIKLKLVSILFLVTLLTMEFSPFAVKATAQQLNFYSAGLVSVGHDSYNNKNVWYANATLGGVTAYCMDYTCAAPSGTMTFRGYLSDQGMAILIHGYPNCSPQSIGCTSADEAYMATQMAFWEVMNRTGESHKAGKIFRVENVTPKKGMEGFYNRTVAAAARLVAMAEAKPYTSNPSMVINNSNVALNYIEGDALIGPYTVNISGTDSLKSITATLVNSPKSARVTDANGNAKTSLSNGESVYVRMNTSEESTSFNIKFRADADRKVGCIYEKAGQGVQDFVRLDTEPNTMEKELTINWEKVTTLGKIELIKVDQDNQPVVGAKFALKEKNGNVLGEVETGTDGKITFYSVPVGEYILEEISAPTGYIIKDKSKNVTIKGGETSTVKFVNERITGKLVITKIDDANKPLANVIFEIYDSEGYVVKRVTTDSNGKASVNVNYGTYFFKEVSAPEGYIMDETLYKFTVNEENRTFYKTVTNDRYKGNLLIVKTDENNTPIENVKFNILDSNKNVITTITTNAKGLAGVKNLPLGTYYYQEIEAPKYVVVDKNVYEFKIETKDQIVRKDIVNEVVKGTLKITKVNENDKPIANVKFNVLDKDKNVVDTLVTNNEGIATSKELAKGTYYYKEVEVPAGYIMDSSEYEFRIENNNQVLNKKVVNYTAEGSLKIIKYDTNKKVLKDVKFNILDENKNVVDTIVTDSNGIAMSKKLPLGVYFYQEVEVPENIVLDDKLYTFALTENNQVITKTVVNKYINGKLSIIKVDENKKPLEGVKFNILDKDKNIVDTIVTDNLGNAVSKDLVKGTYYYQEIEAPKGIVVDDTIYEFKIEYNNQNVIKNIVNRFARGNIVITKYDNAGNLLANVKFQILNEAKEVVDTIVTNENGVAESKDLVLGKYFYKEIEAPSNVIIDTEEHEFKLNENNEVVQKTVINDLKEGSLKITKYDSNNKTLANVKFNITDKDGKVVDTITTDLNGIAISKKLVIGTYYYQEIEAPEHVVIDTNKYEFTLTNNNQVIEKTVVNEIKTGKLKIIKVDENNKPLEGVTFNIYDLDKNLVDTIVTNEEGIAESKELEKGKYYYQEIKAPEGIVVDSTMYEFEIVEDCQNVIKNMINYYAKGELSIIKYDSNKKNLAGVKFNIINVNGEIVDTIITNIEGKAVSKKLPLGTYYYQEIEAPDYVVIDTNKYEFALTENNQVIEKTVVNEIKTGKLKIKKVDENNKPLEGVTFNIYDLDKNLVDTIVTNEEGIAESKELEKGKYYYQEIKAPEGIVVDSTMYEFEIVEDGQNVIRDMINYYVKGQLKIYKLEKDTTKTLSNAKFNIYDENRNLVDIIVTGQDGIATSKKLPYGTYYYKEVEAPEGYVLDNTEHEFKIENEKVIEAVVYNTKEELPKTGGLLSSDAEIVLVISIISVLGYILVCALRKKQEI